MKRLYKFFTVLYIILLAVSFIYATIICWATYNLLSSKAIMDVKEVTPPFSDFLKIGFTKALVYSLALLLMVIFLLKTSLSRGQRFTIKNIIHVALWFYLVTTLCFLVHYLAYGNLEVTIALALGPEYLLPPLLWVPFPVAWLSLVVIIAAQIRKTT